MIMIDKKAVNEIILNDLIGVVADNIWQIHSIFRATCRYCDNFDFANRDTYYCCGYCDLKDKKVDYGDFCQDFERNKNLNKEDYEKYL